MKEKFALELISGMDEATLTAISNFGGSYLKYLWWENIILPNLWRFGLAVLVILTLITINKKMEIENKKEDD